MSHLLCSLLSSYASIGMGSWSTSCRRIVAWKGLVRLAVDSLTLEPCAGSKKACLMSGFVLITAFRGCWIFSLFLSHFLSLLSHLACLPLLPPSSVPVSPGDAFLMWGFAHSERGGAGPTLAPFQAHCFLDFVAYCFHPIPCFVEVRLFDKVN